MSIYQDKGYRNRKEYLEAVAEDFGVPKKVVFAMASMLGEEEDFDALVSEIEDFAGLME